MIQEIAFIFAMLAFGAIATFFVLIALIKIWSLNE
jgi:hypothetical protein